MPVVDALALAGRVLHNPQPAVRGFSGETFSGLWFREPAYVRLYLRDPARAQVDLALLHLLEGKIPLARVLAAVTEVPTSATALPAHVVTAAVPGQRADSLLKGEMFVPAAQALGRQCTRLLAALRQIRFDNTGPLVGRYPTADQWPAEYASLTAFARYLEPGLSRAGLDVAAHSPLMNALSAADTRLAGTQPRQPSLVHGDLNGKNMIVDPNTGRLRAVLDWEHAYAGDWLADLGNLLRGVEAAPRPTQSAAVAFRDGLVESTHEILTSERTVDSPVPQDWLVRARDRDLFALLELAASPLTGAAATAPVVQARDLLARSHTPR